MREASWHLHDKPTAKKTPFRFVTLVMNCSPLPSHEPRGMNQQSAMRVRNGKQQPTLSHRLVCVGLRIRGSGVRISPSAPALRPAIKGFVAVRLRSSPKIPCCVLYFLNPSNIWLSRLVPSSLRNTDATRRFVICSHQEPRCQILRIG